MIGAGVCSALTGPGGFPAPEAGVPLREPVSPTALPLVPAAVDPSRPTAAAPSSARPEVGEPT